MKGSERVNFHPNLLHVEFREGITPRSPIIGRRYTLTHSDLTSELFLTIGLAFALDKINATRDEVLGEWFIAPHHYTLYLYCYVGGERGFDNARKRYAIFKKELHLVIESIRYGDKDLFKCCPHLTRAPIWIVFNSTFPQFKRIEYWGTLG